ncbi:TraL conjugative transposon family protein [Parabacteroides chongii]|uniref:TraL conjugative transposon family protein n=1 Tax=Parabacteroides chongii TaxID=2685834 RepID=UPI00240DA27F|nr:TraL conjugative transposon family protein [Parabacteroides chongii]WFE86188.1 TraL conjugative transposon family protein [Parabacteroides chongii]
MKGKSIRKSQWNAYQKLHDKKKMWVARLKSYLDGLPPKTRRRIVLVMFAIFAALALHTFSKAVHDIGRSDGSRMRIDHAGQVELFVKPDKNNSFTPYYNMYGTDKERNKD